MKDKSVHVKRSLQPKWELMEKMFLHWCNTDCISKKLNLSFTYQKFGTCTHIKKNLSLASKTRSRKKNLGQISDWIFFHLDQAKPSLKPSDTPPFRAPTNWTTLVPDVQLEILIEKNINQIWIEF